MKEKSISEQEWTRIRLAAVAKQLVDRGIRDQRVLAAMREIPRHRFLPPEMLGPMAYADRPLPIGNGQTISQPYIVAYIAEKLELTGKEIVLEIGTGSGFQAAVLSKLAKEVASIDVEPSLVKFAQANLEALGITNVEVIEGDGSAGWMPNAPYDRIVIAAGLPAVPAALMEQLGVPGKLIAPLGGRTRQMLTLIEKKPGSDGGAPEISHKPLIAVNFVPFKKVRGKESDL